jgi:hypothetical protein
VEEDIETRLLKAAIRAVQAQAELINKLIEARILARLED